MIYMVACSPSVAVERCMSLVKPRNVFIDKISHFTCSWRCRLHMLQPFVKSRCTSRLLTMCVTCSLHLIM